MTKKLSLGALGALAALLILPGAAFAQDPAELLEAKSLELDMTWVAVACILVFLMQAGFMFLEIGFSRQKNVGTGVAKIFVNFAMITIAWWAIGYGISGPGNDFFGTDGFFFHFGQEIGSGEDAFTVAGSDAMLMLFGLAFAAVSLAIVWGTTLERIKFGAYVIYAAVFGAVIYPLIAHSVWGGGLLADVDGVVADPLQRPGDEDHRRRPLAAVGLVADLDRDAEALAVERVDDVVLPHQVPREVEVAPGERPLRLVHLGAHL